MSAGSFKNGIYKMFLEIYLIYMYKKDLKVK